MGWLRRDRDCIALVAAWALLLQSAILSFGFGLHASAFAASPDQTAILCSVQGTIANGQAPAEHRHEHDLACCTLSCRSACGGHSGGVLADNVRVPLPGSAVILAATPEAETILPAGAEHEAPQPRAPPLA
jgi:hypothetical protein